MTTQRDLAKAVGVSGGGIHYVLRALAGKGLLKLGNFTAAADNRRYAYVLTPKRIAVKAALTRKFLIRKMAEYEAIKAEIEDVHGDLSEGELAANTAGCKGRTQFMTPNKMHAICQTHFLSEALCAGFLPSAGREPKARPTLDGDAADDLKQRN